MSPYLPVTLNVNLLNAIDKRQEVMDGLKNYRNTLRSLCFLQETCFSFKDTQSAGAKCKDKYHATGNQRAGLVILTSDKIAKDCNKKQRRSIYKDKRASLSKKI